MKFAAQFDRNIVHSKMLMTANSSSLAKTEERLMHRPTEVLLQPSRRVHDIPPKKAGGNTAPMT
ncbi:MAG: hypothetical protein E6G79_24215 [Alphaproteobacteria bacterium]|nr:MAG: hypothetical protein E6G79_24215 [Alphaproteobacteria bacterium]